MFYCALAALTHCVRGVLCSVMHGPPCECIGLCGGSTGAWARVALFRSNFGLTLFVRHFVSSTAAASTHNMPPAKKPRRSGKPGKPGWNKFNAARSEARAAQREKAKAAKKEKQRLDKLQKQEERKQKAANVIAFTCVCTAHLDFFDLLLSGGGRAHGCRSCPRAVLRLGQLHLRCFMLCPCQFVQRTAAYVVQAQCGAAQ